MSVDDFHYVIDGKGAIREILSPNFAGSHCPRYASSTIGILLVGGRDTRGNVKANYSAKQYSALVALLSQLQAKFPAAEPKGIRELGGGLSPYFNVSELYEKRKATDPT